MNQKTVAKNANPFENCHYRMISCQNHLTRAQRMKSKSAFLPILLSHNQQKGMKKYVLLTAKGQVNLDNIAVGNNFIVSQPFDWKELQMWIKGLIKRGTNRKRMDKQIDYRPKEITVASVNELLMQRIMKVIEENMTNAEFSVDVFAKEAGMSTAQLYRKLTVLTGYAPNDFMRHMRLQRAADLLMKKAGNVSEIGYQVGFNNLSYFSKCFKEKFGTLPSSFLGSRCGDLK